jgi:multisubunit Na+/H+ antiporter MnhG subunit
MGLDIRLPIGLMFAIFGVLLAGFGLFSDKSVYDRSLGININLIWGTILIGFSVILLWLSSRKGHRD